MAAARGELGSANPNELKAPGGGVTEIVSLVRALVREAFLEEISRQVEDRGFQQGWPTPATVYQRRISLGMRLRAAFLALWRRASDRMEVTGRPSLRDEDGAPVARGMPDMYTPSAFPPATRSYSASSPARARSARPTSTG